MLYPNTRCAAVPRKRRLPTLQTVPFGATTSRVFPRKIDEVLTPRVRSTPNLSHVSRVRWLLRFWGKHAESTILCKQRSRDNIRISDLENNQVFKKQVNDKTPILFRIIVLRWNVFHRSESVREVTSSNPKRINPKPKEQCRIKSNKKNLYLHHYLWINFTKEAVDELGVKKA